MLDEEPTGAPRRPPPWALTVHAPLRKNKRAGFAYSSSNFVCAQCIRVRALRCVCAWCAGPSVGACVGVLRVCAGMQTCVGSAR